MQRCLTDSATPIGTTGLMVKTEPTNLVRMRTPIVSKEGARVNNEYLQGADFEKKKEKGNIFLT